MGDRDGPTDTVSLHQVPVSEQEADFQWKLLFKQYAPEPACSPIAEVSDLLGFHEVTLRTLAN
jgi:hypothetical protein